MLNRLYRAVLVTCVKSVASVSGLIVNNNNINVLLGQPGHEIPQVRQFIPGRNDGTNRQDGLCRHFFCSSSKSPTRN